MSIDILSLGLSYKTLRGYALELTQKATVIAGHKSALQNFTCAKRIYFENNIIEFLDKILAAQEKGERVVVLSTGDSLFHGLGSSLKKAAQERGVTPAWVFWPGVSYIQKAASLLELSFADLRCLSLHGLPGLPGLPDMPARPALHNPHNKTPKQSGAEGQGGQGQPGTGQHGTGQHGTGQYAEDPMRWHPLWRAMLSNKNIALLTDATHTPANIAEKLLKRGAHNWKMHVFEKLDDANLQKDACLGLSLQEVAEGSFQAPNLVVLQKTEALYQAPVLGLSDTMLAREGSPLTKAPLRALAISALQLMPDHILWDLGAGCGGVSLEASKVLTLGSVFAVEQHKNRVGIIEANRSLTQAWNVEVVWGRMEEALSGLPAPHRIFLGGGLGGGFKEKPGHILPGARESAQEKGSHHANKEALLGAIAEKLQPKGRFVAHCVLMGSLYELLNFFKKTDWEYGVSSISICESRPLGGDLQLVPLNPVYSFWAQKPG